MAKVPYNLLAGVLLDNTNSSSGFTALNGISAHSNELEAQGTGTVSATGSLENITTTSQSGNSQALQQPHL